MASFEEYYDDVLEVETEYHIDSEEEDDEMPPRIHGYLQFQILLLLKELLKDGFKPSPPVTFKGVTQRYTPDVSIYHAAPIRLLTNPASDEIPPLLAIEIISPGQTISAMVKKCEGMIASGVEECWIVEPANESITVCTKERRFVRHEGEVLTNRFLREPLTVEAIFYEELQ